MSVANNYSFITFTTCTLLSFPILPVPELLKTASCRKDWEEDLGWFLLHVLLKTQAVKKLKWSLLWFHAGFQTLSTNQTSFGLSLPRSPAAPSPPALRTWPSALTMAASLCGTDTWVSNEAVHINKKFQPEPRAECRVVDLRSAIPGQKGAALLSAPE